jgi:hypothetical protein
MPIDKTIIGARVTLGPNVTHKQFSGLSGIVHKAIASRNEYAVRLDDGRTYYANPENVVACVTVPFVDISHITDGDGVTRRLSSALRVF